jgi:hypothetical protein
MTLRQLWFEFREENSPPSCRFSDRAIVARCSPASRDAALYALDPACAPGSRSLTAEPATSMMR